MTIIKKDGRDSVIGTHCISLFSNDKLKQKIRKTERVLYCKQCFTIFVNTNVIITFIPTWVESRLCAGGRREREEETRRWCPCFQTWNPKEVGVLASAFNILCQDYQLRLILTRAEHLGANHVEIVSRSVFVLQYYTIITFQKVWIIGWILHSMHLV